MDTKNKILMGAGAFVVLCIVVFGGLYLTRNFGKSDKQVSSETALATIDRLYDKVKPSVAPPIKSSIEYSDNKSAADELPDIDSSYPTVVRAGTDLSVELWSSGEKAGTGTDGWLTEMARRFNAAGVSVNGKTASVTLRSIPSGTSVDYIASGKRVPDGYTPSNALWVSMLNAKGVQTTTVTERLAGNVAGVVIKNNKYDELVQKYGSIDMKAVTQAVSDGALQFGYTNPFTSATGLNFLISTLVRYDTSNPLSDVATEGFRSFQRNVPFVSLTTQQMHDAAQRDTLDGFVTEYQVYHNDQQLQGAYKFAAFGYRHDNPLVAVSGASDDAKAVLDAFAQYCAKDSSQQLASEDGFNGLDDYVSESAALDGQTIIHAQELYKRNKDSGNPVVAVFVADVSGSMGGEPINALKSSLINSMSYIGTENYIGLVSYSDDVTINVPIERFDMNQQRLFKGGVESLSAGGSTATFDGVIVAMKMVQDKLKEIPNARPMIFVLSDGDTNRGHDLNDIRSPIEALDVPIYTIGYNANISALKQISSVSEAATIDASTDDVTYQLRQLFNASM